MPIVRVQSTLHNDSNLPKDQVVNNWYFKTGALPEYFESDPYFAVRQFYEAVQSFLSPVLNGTITHRLYEMSDPKPRVPRFSGEQTIVPGSGALPDEVACCLSFRAAYASGTPNARKRGRTYIGPLAEGAASPSWPKRPKPELRAALLAGAAAIATRLDGGAWDWVVYSGRTAGVNEGAAEAGFKVVEAWVDDAFDTVRSRGPAATLKQTAAITQ